MSYKDLDKKANRLAKKSLASSAPSLRDTAETDPPRPTGGRKSWIVVLALVCVLSVYMAGLLPDDLRRSLSYSDSSWVDFILVGALPFIGVNLLLWAWLGSAVKASEFLAHMALSFFLTVPVSIGLVIGPGKWLSEDDVDKSRETHALIERFRDEAQDILNQVVAAAPFTFDAYAVNAQEIRVQHPTGVIWIDPDGDSASFPKKIGNMWWVPNGVTYVDAEGNKQSWSLRAAVEGRVSDELSFEMGSLLVVIRGAERSGRELSVKERWSVVEYLSFADMYYIDLARRQRIKLPFRVYGPEYEIPLSLQPTIVTGSVTERGDGEKPDQIEVLRQADEYFAGNPWLQQASK